MGKTDRYKIVYNMGQYVHITWLHSGEGTEHKKQHTNICL